MEGQQSLPCAQESVSEAVLYLYDEDMLIAVLITKVQSCILVTNAIFLM
jgi:hypothetical protein